MRLGIASLEELQSEAKLTAYIEKSTCPKIPLEPIGETAHAIEVLDWLNDWTAKLQEALAARPGEQTSKVLRLRLIS